LTQTAHWDHKQLYTEPQTVSHLRKPHALVSMNHVIIYNSIREWGNFDSPGLSNTTSSRSGITILFIILIIMLSAQTKY